MRARIAFGVALLILLVAGAVVAAPLKDGQSGDELKVNPPSAGFAVFENTDAYTLTNDVGQSATFKAKA